MTTYAKRKLKYSRNENFNLLHYVEWDRIATLSQHKRTEGYVIVSTCSYCSIINIILVAFYPQMFVFLSFLFVITCLSVFEWPFLITDLSVVEWPFLITYLSVVEWPFLITHLSVVEWPFLITHLSVVEWPNTHLSVPEWPFLITYLSVPEWPFLNTHLSVFKGTFLNTHLSVFKGPFLNTHLSWMTVSDYPPLWYLQTFLSISYWTFTIYNTVDWIPNLIKTLHSINIWNNV